MNQTQNNGTSKKAMDQESLLAIFLIGLIVFFLIMTMVLLLRSCGAEDQLPNDTQGDSQSESESETLPPSPGSIPVFSGGVGVKVPNSSAATVTLWNEIDSQYAILIRADSGEILAQKNAETAFSPASMTKVMTLIVACEYFTEKDLNRQLVLSAEVVDYVTSGNYLGTEVALPTESNGITCIGDTYSIKDLLYGIGVMSAADCTYMIVREVAETEQNFVDMMNAKAEALGLSGTHFDNAVGFDSATNVTTASDMAMIMAYAMQCDLIVDILKPRSERMQIQAYYEHDGETKSYPVYLKPSIKSRMDKYPEFSLSDVTLQATKTGYTNESFIVASAVSKTTGECYILVLGDVKGETEESLTQKFKNTMVDMEFLFNTYAS